MNFYSEFFEERKISLVNQYTTPKLPFMTAEVRGLIGDRPPLDGTDSFPCLNGRRKGSPDLLLGYQVRIGCEFAGALAPHITWTMSRIPMNMRRGIIYSQGPRTSYRSGGLLFQHIGNPS